MYVYVNLLTGGIKVVLYQAVHSCRLLRSQPFGKMETVSQHSADSERVKKIEVDLAQEFLSLVGLVQSNNRVARECALKAFSQAPTHERYYKLRNSGG